MRRVSRPTDSTHRSRRALLLLFTCALAVAILAAVLGAAAALGQDETASPAADGGKVVLKIGWTGEVDNLNPFIGWTNNVYQVFGCEYLQMVGRNWDTGKPDGESGICKSWELSDDQLVWTFTVNEGLTWHDGEPITAEDAVFTYNYIIENEISAFITFLGGVDRAELVDEYTFQVICNEPVANLLNLWFICLPEHIWGDMTAKEATVTFQNDPPNIGSGPWQVTEWKRNDYLKMTAFRDWHDGGPTVDELYYVLYQNGDTMVQDFLAGNLDAIYQFPPAQYDKIASAEGVEAIKYTYKNWDYVGFNCYEGPSEAATRPCSTPTSAGPSSTRSTARTSSRTRTPATPSRGTRSCRPTRGAIPTTPGRPTRLSGATTTPTWRTSSSTKAGMSTRTETGSASTRARTSSCVSGPSRTFPESQRSTKLIAGYWESVGIDVKFSVQDDGVYFDSIWGYKGDTFVPRLRRLPLGVGRLQRPRPVPHVLHDSADRGLERVRVGERSIHGARRVAGERDGPGPARRVHPRDAGGHVRGLPCIVTAHPYKLQAYRTDRWDGWRLTGGPDGEYGQQYAFMTQASPWEFFYLTPKVAEEETSNLGLWVAIILAIVVVAAIVTWLIVRSRRGGPAEEV